MTVTLIYFLPIQSNNIQFQEPIKLAYGPVHEYCQLPLLLPQLYQWSIRSFHSNSAKQQEREGMIPPLVIN